MKTTSPLYFTLAMLAFTSGCKKEEGSPGHPAPPLFTHPLSAWRTGNELAATQTFTVDAAMGDTLELAGHAKIVFDPAAFITSGGAPVSGPVRVKVLVILDAAAMVLVSTSIGDNSGTRQLLKSGGELKITADQNDVQVGIVPNSATVMLPGSDPDTGMRTCYSTHIASYTSDLVWTTTADTALVVPDSILEAYGEGDWFYYTFTINSLGWVGCGTFQAGATAFFNVATPPGIDYENAYVRVMVPAYNTAVNRSGLVGGTYHHFDDLPIGLDAVIVSLAAVDGQYYASFTNITIADGLAPSLTYQATTLEEFEAAVRAL
jgi:hypothetical protein